jgi:hypothetical protein
MTIATVLCVSRDESTHGALRALDPARFRLHAVPPAEAERACREIVPDKVVVDARSDPTRSYRLVRTLTKPGPERPVVILVGGARERSAFEQHAQLRGRADAYVILGEPAELARTVEDAVRRSGSRGTQLPFPTTSILMVLAAVTAPVLHATDHFIAGAVAAAGAAAIGLGDELAAWRRGRRKRLVLAIAYMALLSGSVWAGVATYVRP